MAFIAQAADDFSNMIFGGGDSNSKGETASTDHERHKEEQEIAHKERGLKQLLYFARKKYIDRGLEGSITIGSTLTFYTHSIVCNVKKGDAAAAPDDVALAEDISTTNAHTISAMDGVLSILERRARGYRKSAFRDDVTLSSGLHVTIPFIGMASVSLTFTATVKSLLASIDAWESQKLRSKGVDNTGMLDEAQELDKENFSSNQYER
jgi:hypothetical protein